jgi:hypothetical protein
MSQWADAWDYEPHPVDADEGFTGRMDAASGRTVWMCKSRPGLYVTQSGEEVPDEEAKAVGFDLEKDRAEADVLLKVRDATAKIHRDAAAAERRIRGEEPEANPFEEKAIAKRAEKDFVTDRTSSGDPRGTKDYKMVHRGGSYWDVVERSSDEAVEKKRLKEEAVKIMLELQASAEAA